MSEPAPVPAAPPQAQPPGEPDLRLRYFAVSDVGRVRKDNQDSGYAGPWLLDVCDGVGGAARGDIASSTAVEALRTLDEPPPPGDDPPILDRLTVALHAAHEQIGHLVDADPSINGTATTATVVLFDGRRVGVGHVGDSRAYLFRDREISQLTTDHTFVQSLIDEGRVTPEEARVHPHRNLILKALDGVHEAEPDLFVLEVVTGDRLLLCSDGACGVLDDGRLADILSMGTPEYAAVELVRASLEAGSSDNVTCIVADVVSQDSVAADPASATTRPVVVGAAEQGRRPSRAGSARSLFRGHRSGDTGELEPVDAEIPDDLPFTIPSDPLDPEALRYAPRPPERYQWLRRLLGLAVVVGLVWIALAAAWSVTQRQYYIGEHDGYVAVYRGVDVGVSGLGLSTVVATTSLPVDQLAVNDRDGVGEGIAADDLADAEDKIGVITSHLPASSTTQAGG